MSVHSFLRSSVVLCLTLGCLNFCTSYPADSKMYKEKSPLLSLLLSFPAMEVDEPGRNTIEILNNDQTFPSATGIKHKRNQLFPETSNSCCPTVVELIEPLGGKNRSGDLVELYQADGVRQRFYEISCAPDVAEKSCRFLDRRHTSHSKCVQQYSYTYALVRDFGANYDDGEDSSSRGGWRLDYIKVRSGCSCQISPRHSSHHNSS